MPYTGNAIQINRVLLPGMKQMEFENMLGPLIVNKLTNNQTVGLKIKRNCIIVFENLLLLFL